MNSPAIHRAPSKWFVSCVMPTTQRRAKFLSLSIRSFLSQKWKEKELLIVGDPGYPVALPEFAKNRGDIRVIYAGPMLGIKHNVAKAEARGRYVAKTDDDDFYGPRRLLRQMEPIAIGGADCTAFPNSFAFDLESGKWYQSNNKIRYPFHDATFVFDKERCSAIDFGNRWGGEGLVFARRLRLNGLTLSVIPNLADFVYMRHGRNTWRFYIGKFYRLAKRPSFFPASLEAEYRNAIK
jgi:glycosyltransferase involved in cell wall biosynthesis